MKTKKILSAIVLVTIFAAVTSVVIAGSQKILPRTITYIVNIDKSMQSGGGLYIITVLNQKGLAIAHPQVFKDGVWTYTFQEYGPVADKFRTVTMVLNPGSKVKEKVVFDPVTLTGPFLGGKTYKFLPLLPRPDDEGNPDAQGDAPNIPDIP
jgi:hypothetical protein